MLDPNCPEIYPRRILLAVTGLSPQVVTETLYALAVKRNPPFVPTEVVLITTRPGADHARLNLLSHDPGWFHRLCREYSLPQIAFAESSIRIIRNAQGELAEDIRTPEDNERAADFIAGVVRELTADPNCALHVSIAGGRKTMGYYLGYALSLYGRPQDRLSHVLVSPPFESHPQFFYPTSTQRIIYTLDKQQTPLDCSQAEVMLAEIPFVSLRHGLPEALLQGEASFSQTVAAAKRAYAPPQLLLDLSRQTICAAGETVHLPPAELAFYSVFARRAMAGEEPLRAPKKGVPDQQWAQRFLAEYQKVRGELADVEATERALRDGMDGEYFSQRKAKLERILRRRLGPVATPYLVTNGGKRPGRYALNLPKEAIDYVS
ncbi:MAG: CRISPR-associated ring nuclease Csm6 [Methylohalobius sp.]|nr:CRISPR-associated ring nuclease Csm6 [Methylohalobius sp.]